MLRVNGISKAYGGQAVLENVSLIVNDRERVGLVGSNGCGKSTLLEIINGNIKPDSGNVWLSPGSRIGYVSQSLVSTNNQAITIAGVLDRQLGNNVVDIHLALEERQTSPSKQEYGQEDNLWDRYMAVDGPEKLAKIHKAMSVMGLSEFDWMRDIVSLSGGERTRLALASILAFDPTVILLDEPTNNLDLEALMWLESFLADSSQSILVVSHDRWFLDRVVTKIIEIDQFSHTATEYAGNYTDYAEENQARRERQHQAHLGYEKEAKRIATAIQRQKQWAQSAARGEEPKDNDKFIRGFRKDRSVKSSGAALGLERRLERLEQIDDVRNRDKTKVGISSGRSGSQSIIQVEDLSYSIGKKTLFAGLQLSVTRGERVVIMGENGVGKTTLLRLILGDLLPEKGIIKVAGVNISYLPQESIWMNPKVTLLDWLRQNSVGSETEHRYLLAQFHFYGDEAFKRIGSLSSGEMSKLRLAQIVTSQPDLLVMDEPTNHLDFDCLSYLESQLARFDGTIIVVSHDRYFLRELGVSRFYLLTREGLLIQYNYLEEILEAFS